MEFTHEPQHFELVDPDPYTVAACWIAAAALVLQFTDFVRTTPPQPVAPIVRTAPFVTSLEQLEGSLEDVERTFDLLTRTIDRGSPDPDGEFFDAEFGVGRSSLRLEHSRHDAFTSHLAEAFAKVGALSRWANHVIRQQPDAAVILGQHLMKDLEQSSDRLNALMRQGATNRALMTETRFVISTMRVALTALLKNRET